MVYLSLQPLSHEIWHCPGGHPVNSATFFFLPIGDRINGVLLYHLLQNFKEYLNVLIID